MHTELTPGGFGPPSANYALAVVSDNPTRWLHTSGIGPIRPDGEVPDGLDDQASTVWATIEGLVMESGLELTDIVSVTTYVVEGNDFDVVIAARDAALGKHRCASTLVSVPALAPEGWKMEIAVVAAGATPQDSSESNG